MKISRVKESQILQAWSRKMAINIQQPHWGKAWWCKILREMLWRGCHSEGEVLVYSTPSNIQDHNRSSCSTPGATVKFPLTCNEIPTCPPLNAGGKLSSPLKFLSFSLFPACKKKQELFAPVSPASAWTETCCTEKKGNIPMYPLLLLLCHHLTFCPNL